jgi:4-carboxymuconolactone decarboxylase
VSDPVEEAIEALIGPYRATTDRTESEMRFRELFGFMPPPAVGRMLVQGALDPNGYDLTEQLRAQLQYPNCFDVKTAQLMIFGMMLGQLSAGAEGHAIAARKAGAGWDELNAVVGLAFLFSGLSAANRGAEIIASIARREHDAARA